MAKAFASGEGLAYLLTKVGIARPKESQQFLSRFTCGFSQADDMFDFVLVGKGKDRADHKVMGWFCRARLFPQSLILVILAAFRPFVKSPSCQHVLLACCHDNGYVRMLEKYVHNPVVVEKVTMVKPFQSGSEFAGLPFRSVTMASVFRSRPLPGDGLPLIGTTPIITRASPPPPAQSPSQMNKNSSPPATYASRAAAVQPGMIPPQFAPRPLPIFGTRETHIILVNADGHRIDMPLPAKSAASVDSFNRKTYSHGKRFCNSYQLQGFCPGNCEYLHEQLTAGENLVMRHQLRGRKCHDRGNCRDALCYYGHHCACPGVGSKCSFPVAMHRVDVASWREVNTAILSG
jgi:hypothetical protein